jgi:GNAT superfamily N-acetyltransferase
MSSEASARGVTIRRARVDEAASLTDLALRSKAYWGYDEDFIDACRTDLTLTSDYLANNPVFVAESESQLEAFYSLKQAGAEVELDYLHVEPTATRGGFGRVLFEHAVSQAAALGYTRMLIDSDPNAEGFYLAMGAERVGEVESPVRPGRMMPRLVYSLRS